MTLDALDALPAGSARPDVDAIRTLINVWDHRCTAPRWRDCPHPEGAVTRFANLLRRRRQSIYNLSAPGKRIGYVFAAQIAEALHVKCQDAECPGYGRADCADLTHRLAGVTLPETAGTEEDPQPQARAA